MKLESQVSNLELSKKLKELEGYEGLYAVDQAGDVYSLARKNGMGSRKRTRLRATKICRGYKSVTLCKNGKLRSYTVHRLVAQTFVGNSKGYKQVNHKDGNKLNNSVSNLEWCDASYNQNHARRLGLQGGELSNTAKLTTERVRDIRSAYSKGTTTMKRLGESYGVNEQTISKIINYKTWKYA
jgi:hypothetical protein